MLSLRPRAALLGKSELVFTLSLLVTSSIASAQSTNYLSVEQFASETANVSIEQLQQQIDEQSKMLRKLQERLDESDMMFGLVSDTSDDSCAPAMKERVALVAELPVEASCDGRVRRDVSQTQLFRQL